MTPETAKKLQKVTNALIDCSVAVGLILAIPWLYLDDVLQKIKDRR